jgi:large subunit ribosomal protein L30
MNAQLRVRQTRSTIGETFRMRRVVKGLGLHGIGSVVVVDNTPSFRGMVKKIMHLVSVEELAGERKEAPRG